MRGHRGVWTRPAILAICGVVASGCAGEPAQPPILTATEDRITTVERFAGEARIRAAGELTPVRVTISTWTLGGGLRLDELPLESKGLMIVHLRGGQVTTVIDGTREERREGAFWTVPAGVRMGVETGDDSAILQTTVVGQP